MRAQAVMGAAAERHVPIRPTIQHNRLRIAKNRRVAIRGNQPDDDPIALSHRATVEIEILPASVLFEAGETLRVTVIGSDLHAHEAWRHDGVRTVNRGTHVIHTGGTYDSHLLVPVIPAA